MCAFAAFGGIFFGYDSGYISGVMGMSTFYHLIEGQDATALSATNKSLITSILSAGTLYVSSHGPNLCFSYPVSRLLG